MRIGILATFPNPELPGASRAGYRRLSQLIQALSPAHTVHLFVVGKSPWHPTVPGCRSTRVLAASHLPGRWLKLIITFWLTRHGVDLWIAYNPSKTMLPLLLLRWLRIPVVVDYCDKQAAIDHWGGGVRSRVYLGLQSAVERLLLCRIGAFLVISNALRAEVLEANPQARCLLYRGTFAPPNLSEAGIELSGASCHILYLGALHGFNGPATLIKALARIARDAPALRLLIVGPGPESDRSDLQALAVEESVAHRVEFHTGLSDAQVFDVLRRVDMLAVPYLDHPRNRLNFPTKLIEYLWAAKPILASCVGEIPDVLNDEQAILLTPGEVGDWGVAMQKLYDDRGLCSRLGRNAAKLYREQFSPSVARKTVGGFLTSIDA